METWLIILLCAVCTIAAVVIAWCVALEVIVSSAFSSRQDKNENYKYFTSDDFGVNEEELAVYYNKIALSAHIYTAKPIAECDRVVIFSHGFGAGTSSYTTEICALAKRGYAVVAADVYGCNRSGGKNIKGFYAGAEAVIATYIAVKGDSRFDGKKIVLVGHSWGGYSVLCASTKVAVDGVVALSAFDTPVSAATNFVKNSAMVAMVKVGTFLSCLFRFGFNGNASAVKRIEKSKTKALLIHGELDEVVPYRRSAAKSAKGANVEKLICADKYHNPYDTVAAESKLRELLSADFKDKDDEREFCAAFDWKAAIEEDEAVMQKIFAFIESV